MASNTTATAGEMDRGNTTTLIIAMAVVVTALLLWAFSGSGIDSREPPEVRAKIPFLGHIIGMLTYHVDYYAMLKSKFQLPIFTVRILGSSMYIISSPELIQSVLRNPKAFPFEPMVIESTNRAFDISKEGSKIIANMDYIDSIHKFVHETMQPGPALLEMNGHALSTEARLLNGSGFGIGKRIGLYKWIRDCVTLAAANALYGPKNPVSDDPKLIDMVWDFETDFIWLMLRFLPNLTARKAYKARATFREAFRGYYAAGYKGASSFIQDRVATAKRGGLGQDDFLNVEIGMLFTASTNTAPSTFWFICYILSSESLLAEVRAEISKIVSRKTVNGIDTLELDSTGIQQHCPLLISIWEETLRLVDSSSSVRMVAKDTMLADRYLLKANSVVQMPSGTTHLSTDIWGPDAATFKPKRFLKPKSEEKLDAAGREKRKLQTQGYFPFGGGKHLCPGRHFAFIEVMSLVATMVYGFDIKMANGSAEFKAPKADLQKMGTGVRKPVNDIDVLIKARPGLEGAKWAYSVGKEVDIKLS